MRTEINGGPTPSEELRHSRTSGAHAVEPDVRQGDEGFRDFAESLVQHMDEVFFWRHPDSLKPYFVSHAYERIWGQPCHTAYSDPSSWIESIHPDDRDRVTEEFERAATAGQAQIEYRIVRPDGEVRWIWARTFLVRSRRPEP